MIKKRYLPLMAVMLLGSSMIITGCGHGAKTAAVTPSSFRADPSKMTADEKVRFDTLTHASTQPVAKK